MVNNQWCSQVNNHSTSSPWCNQVNNQWCSLVNNPSCNHNTSRCPVSSPNTSRCQANSKWWPHNQACKFNRLSRSYMLNNNHVMISSEMFRKTSQTLPMDLLNHKGKLSWWILISLWLLSNIVAQSPALSACLPAFSV